MAQGIAAIVMALSVVVGCSDKPNATAAAETVTVKEMTVGQETAAALSGYAYSGTVEEENGAQLSFTAGGGAGGGAGGAGVQLERFKLQVAYGKYHVSSSSITVNVSYGL